MSFVRDRIAGLAHPSSLPHSPKEYTRLLERVQKEEQRQRAYARAWALAKEQGVEPIRNIEELRGDFWPEEESTDEFLSWLRDLRQGDNPRSVPE